MQLTDLCIKIGCVIVKGNVGKIKKNTATKTRGINPFYSYCFPSFTWEAETKLCEFHFVYEKSQEVLLLTANFLRGGVSSLMGQQHDKLAPNTCL